MEEKNTCIGDHSRHLCLMGSTMTSYAELDEFKQLVRNPEFICGNCGRVAACADNLCNPVPLKG